MRSLPHREEVKEVKEPVLRQLHSPSTQSWQSGKALVYNYCCFIQYFVGLAGKKPHFLLAEIMKCSLR